MTRSLRWCVVALAASVAVDTHPALARTPIPAGTWLTEDGRARVRTEPCGPRGTSLCGYIVWIRTAPDEAGQPRLDRRNPDPEKRSRPVLGHQLLGLEPNAEGRFAGTIYNADDGKSYDVEVWSEQSSEITVKGCMLALFCGSQTWKRVTDIVPGQLQAPTDTPGGPRADREWAKAARTGSITPKATPSH